MESKTCDVSVVIPVYNSGPFLRRCLDSVLEQTLKSIEVICVDDGSVDDSLEILREYARMDSRIHIIELAENHGLSFARNEGMDLASGTYLYFMDSDDWIDPDYLGEMLRHALRTGQNIVVNSNWFIEYADPAKREPVKKPDFVREEPSFLPPVSLQGTIFQVVWCRLFKTAFVRENHLRFPPLKCAEDNYFSFLSEALQERSYIFSGPYYHYYQRKDSLSRTPDADWYHIRNFYELAKALRARGIPPSKSIRFYFWDTAWRLDSEYKFNYMRDFMKYVEADVLAAPELYNVFGCYIMRAVLSCDSYRTFRIRYFLGFQWSYRLRVILNMRWPTVRTILNGEWRI